ncbi:MAG: hypothetical protein LBQ18_07650, partial [Campylobacteraceae bacterium]|nr:hypothetical protein [Campylobacteraceae bacterium]
PPYNKIENNSNRFLQFGQKEVEAIIYFFQYLHDEIEFLKDKFKNIDFNDKSSAPNTEDNLTMHYLDLLDNEHDIGGALVFWKSHPTINVKLGFYGAKSGVIKP